MRCITFPTSTISNNLADISLSFLQFLKYPSTLTIQHTQMLSLTVVDKKGVQHTLSNDPSVAYPWQFLPADPSSFLDGFTVLHKTRLYALHEMCWFDEEIPDDRFSQRYTFFFNDQ